MSIKTVEYVVTFSVAGHVCHKATVLASSAKYAIRNAIKERHMPEFADQVKAVKK